MKRLLALTLALWVLAAPALAQAPATETPAEPAEVETPPAEETPAVEPEEPAEETPAGEPEEPAEETTAIEPESAPVDSAGPETETFEAAGVPEDATESEELAASQDPTLATPSPEAEPAEPTAEVAATDLPAVDDEIDVEAKKHKSPKAWMQAQPRKKKKTIMGALKGAGIGLAGALIAGKDPLAGAAIGAAAGALAGYLIGRRQDKIFASRDEAIEALGGYDPSQGYVMRVDEVRLDPPNLEPGGSSEMHVRYLVVGPQPKEKIVVHTYTGIRYDEAYIGGGGPKKFTIPRGGGIVNTSITVTIPKDAPDGSYMIQAQVEDVGGRFENTGEGPVYVEAPQEETAEETSEATTST